MKRVAIDVGGTFTDVLVLDEQGSVREFKTPTTPGDPSVGLIQGLEKAARDFGLPVERFAAQVQVLIHGTTLATNALLTGRGARVGMLTTRGFRDLVELRRGYKNIRSSMFNVFVPPYRPLVPRHLRVGIEERSLYTGERLVPLDEAGARQGLEQLARAGVESVAICFLHSYINPANELAAAELARQTLPGAYIVASHDILPVWREYDRFSTTIVSAYIGPLVDAYLGTLAGRLAEVGFRGSLLLVQSDGLVLSAAESRRRAVYLISSGPAAAPSAATFWGGAVGARDLISIDMGGTSLDVCLLRDGEIPTTTESWVGEERVAIKMVDVHSIGAGGGSIAWVDPLGLLRVGPRSAGADPGPVCYGLGGREPTVTDADLVLGYIPDDYFLGGEIRLDAELARGALGHLGQGLALGPTQAAHTIYATVNALIADQIAELSTKRGLDVRDYVLICGGGAGPVHAAAIARAVGMTTVVVPRLSALLSAFGMFAMDIGRSFARSYLRRWRHVDLAAVNGLFAALEGESREALASAGLPSEQVAFARSLDLRYVGQFHELEIPVEGGPLSGDDLERSAATFHERHQRLFGFSFPTHELELLACRTTVTAGRSSLIIPAAACGDSDPSAALKRHRRCFFAGAWTEVTCFDGASLRPGHVLPGPAVIEESTTTVVVPGEFTCSVDSQRNYVLRYSA